MTGFLTGMDSWQIKLPFLKIDFFTCKNKRYTSGN